jgi:23S rRNA (uracil1939-C5)-methyltransferase
MSTITAELTIDRLAAGGEGVGRHEGMAVFVPRTAPGDRVRARLELHRRFARGTVETLLQPSPERVNPPCDHYQVDRCGGCQLQHLAYDAQVSAKRAIVRDALVRIGKREVDAPVVEPSADQWRYRRKLTLAMRRRADRSWVMGLHPYDDPVGVFQLDDCPITDERIVAAWREIMAAGELLPPMLALRGAVLLAESEMVFSLEGGVDWTTASEFFDAVPSIAALWCKADGRGRVLVARRGAAASDPSFMQVNEGVADALHAYVLERTRRHAPSSVVDAYAGSGATAVPLATAGARVVAIELDRDATARCAARLPAGSHAVAGRVEDLLERALPADVVLVNPPRSGVDERVTAILQNAAQPPHAVIYVSCDPATLARDVARLPRYRIASLRAFDMFPQTAHVETVCELVPEPA